MKRLLDVLISAIGLLVAIPVLALLMCAIAIDSRGSPIFAQQRVGHRERLFTCFKLRTMLTGTPHLPTHETSAGAITGLGRLLRKWKLDELPQLYNVIRGDMSLVGPRPCLPSQTELIAARRRLDVFELRPGITGLAQVRGIDMSDAARLAAVDAEYARYRSFGGDLKLLIATIGGKGGGIDRVRMEH